MGDRQIRACVRCGSDTVIVSSVSVSCRCGCTVTGRDQNEAIFIWNASIETVSMEGSCFIDGASAFMSIRRSNAGYHYFVGKSESQIGAWEKGYRHMSRKMTGEEPVDIKVILGPSKLKVIIDKKQYIDGNGA